MQIQEVILKTASIVRTKLFYHKTLELPIIAETDETISFKAGRSLLTFNVVTEGRPFYHIAFNVTNNKFSDSFEWVNNKLDILEADHGLPIANYPEWNAESFYFLDNNGSILEFIARFDLPYYSGEAFCVDDIVEISEVGIVCDDVQTTAQSLNAKELFPYFPKSKPTENFTVLGDDHGLLILTRKGRGWVPTLRPAQIFPLTVVADGKTIEL
jgi:hypothetical protein